MANTGLIYATSVADQSGVGTQTWSSTSNAVGNNNGSSTADVDLGGPSQSHYLKATFSPGLPAGSTVDGIVAAFRRRGSLYDSLAPQDASVRLVKNGTVSGTDKTAGAFWPASLAWSSDYGGATDIWGLTFTNSDTIGLAVSVYAEEDGNNAAIAAFRMTIYYTTATGKKARRTMSTRVGSRGVVS